MYTFDSVGENSAQVNLRWEKVRVPFTVEVKDVTALTLEKARAAVAAAKPDDWRTLLQAANYAIQNKNVEEGMRWLEQSIKVKPTFQNLSAKAIALFNAGRKDEAISIAEQAIQQGKADKVDTTRFEKRLADMKAGKTS
jgi:tetratricopeptide (TPR) repeat protein